MFVGLVYRSRRCSSSTTGASIPLSVASIAGRDDRTGAPTRLLRYAHPTATDQAVNGGTVMTSASAISPIPRIIRIAHGAITDSGDYLAVGQVLADDSYVALGDDTWVLLSANY
jgi:hypothetical protein